MKESLFKRFLDTVQRVAIILALLGAVYYFFSGGKAPFLRSSTGPGVNDIFSESSLINKVASVEISGSSFMARTEAKRLISDGVTGVEYYPQPTPSVTVRIRCGLFKGHEATWKAVLDHWCRYYCFKNNIARVEGRLVNCENKALLGGTFGFED
jgi:hypothetical protein